MKTTFLPYPLYVLLLTSILSTQAFAQPAESENRRCRQKDEIGTGGFPFDDCPWMTPETQNQASVSDVTFTTLIDFNYFGGADFIERWTGPNFFVERTYQWIDPYYLGPCGTGFGTCEYHVDSWLEREVWDVFRAELDADNVGTWVYEEVANGIVGQSKTFEVNELSLNALDGNNQMGLVDEDLAKPLTLKLTAFDEDSIKDEVINWEWSTVPNGAQGMSVSGIGSSGTDDQGIDNAFIHLGSKPGAYTLKLNNRRMVSQPEFTFTAIDDIEDTNPVGFSPDKADTSEKPDNGRGGVSCQNARSIHLSSSGKPFYSPNTWA